MVFFVLACGKFFLFWRLERLRVTFVLRSLFCLGCFGVFRGCGLVSLWSGSFNFCFGGVFIVASCCRGGGVNKFGNRLLRRQVSMKWRKS